MSVAGFRDQRLEVEGWGNGVMETESVPIRRPHEIAGAVGAMVLEDAEQRQSYVLHRRVSLTC